MKGPSRNFGSILRLAISVLLVTISVRTLFVTGWLTPIVVQGSSMAPTLVGPHLIGECGNCGLTVNVGSDQQTNHAPSPCSRCSTGEIRLNASQWHRGDSLLIDRRAAWLAAPRRWDVVVLRNPEKVGTLAVKRVVGRPGETVHFAGGDLWIDGQRVKKSLANQRRVRVEVKDGDSPRSHWRVTDGEWDAKGLCWSMRVEKGAAPATLWYAPPNGKPVRDDLPSNLSVTRQLTTVRHLMFEADFACSGAAIFTATIKLQSEKVVATVDAQKQRVELVVESQAGVSRESSAISSIDGRFTLSTFDRQALFAIGSETKITLPLHELKVGRSDSQQVDLTVARGTLIVRNPSLYRDIYWESQPAGGGGGRREWQLGSESWFVVGDNQAISRDSRNPAWGESGIPGRLICGRVIGY